MRSTPTNSASGPPLEMSKQRLTAKETMRRRLAARSPLAVRFYAATFERMLRKEFHAVRVANLPDKAVFQRPQLVIFTNHPSWWEGVIFLVLAHRLMRDRKVYTPTDAAMVEHYGFIRRIGGFGVEQGRRQGALHFLEACRLLFAEPRNALLVTAQGRFADCRERPLNLESGISHIADLAPNATYLPLAIEYTHWLEKQPELLLRFGEPIAGSALGDKSTAERLDRLEAALTQAMDLLARHSISREASAFQTLVAGRGGINPVYDLWRRGAALASGRTYQPSHGAPP
jgi:1-acyl-sn-glycerol-3-phosphate acyltransferase